MHRSFKKKLWWLFLFILLTGLLNVWISVGIASNDSSKFDVPVKGTYLRADPNQATQAAGSVDPPCIIDLEVNGFSEGDSILISFKGSFDRYGQSDYEMLEYLLGVFSSTNQLLSIYEVARVPGAIDASEDFETSETWFTHMDTDIPEDFKITPSSGFSISVPENAKYLFVCLHDSYYPDNTAPGPIKVSLEMQGIFPWEILLIGLVVAALIIFLGFFYLRKRKKTTKE
jgi:hypothetical protein